MGGIEQRQLRKIYAIGHALGIVSGPGDELHELIEGMTGKTSMKDLTCKEADDVICRLEVLQGGYTPEGPRPAEKKARECERPGGVTSGQQKKAWALMYALKKHDGGENGVPVGNRLCGIIKKELHIDTLPRDPFAWLDQQQGNKLIEVLKIYVANAEGKRR